MSVSSTQAPFQSRSENAHLGVKGGSLLFVKGGGPGRGEEVEQDDRERGRKALDVLAHGFCLNPLRKCLELVGRVIGEKEDRGATRARVARLLALGGRRLAERGRVVAREVADGCNTIQSALLLTLTQTAARARLGRSCRSGSRPSV